jgi:phosphoglycerate dehydrogenase-like enzyme
MTRISMPPVVAVTETEYRRAESVFSSTPGLTCVAAPSNEDALAETIARAGARHAVVGGTAYRDRLYAALPRGGVLARFGVGHDGIDKERATEAGVLCTNTPDVLHQSVAELTLSLIGAAARHLLTVAHALRAGKWAPQEGIELEGKTLVIVGCGIIGAAVARIAGAGYGMRVVGYRRRPASGANRTAGAEHYEHITDDFASAVRAADFVSLHIPGARENRHFINRDRLSLFPERAWLINTARGAVVDESALFDALVESRLAGAALDVFDREPYEPVSADRDLRTLPQVIPVPHIGSNTADANRRMAERALRNILLAEAGDTARMDLLNPDVL